jgi:hypothetical protein
MAKKPTAKAKTKNKVKQTGEEARAAVIAQGLKKASKDATFLRWERVAAPGRFVAAVFSDGHREFLQTSGH